MQFPTLFNQVAASSQEQASKNEVTAEDPVPLTPASRFLEAVRRPMTTPETRRKPRQNNQSVQGDSLQAIHAVIEKAVVKEHEQRREMIKQVEDAQRIEDQRVYHAQLASESRKRRDRRRVQREDASRHRREHAAELKMERLAPRSAHSQANISTLDSHRVELLAWEQSVDSTISSTRPRWVAQPVWSEQQREGCLRQHGLVQECQTMIDSMQQAKTRREQLLAGSPFSSIGSRPETVPV